MYYFIDEDGSIVYNILEFVHPNSIFMFKRDKEYTLCTHRNIGIELFYPDDFYINYIGVCD